MLGKISREMRRERNGDHEANISGKESGYFCFILEKTKMTTLSEFRECGSCLHN